MSNRKIDEKLEEAVISAAVAEMLEQEGKRLQEEFECMDESEKVYPDEKHLSQFEATLNKAHRNWMIIQFFKRIKTPMKRVVTALAAVIVVFSASVVSVEAFRVKFIDWLMGLSDTHIGIKHTNDDFSEYNIFFDIDNLSKKLPDNYILQSIINENDTITATFEKDCYMILIVKYANKLTINVDNEDIESSAEIKINGYDGLLVVKNNTINLIWSDENFYYSIYSDDPNITTDYIKKIAESIK